MNNNDNKKIKKFRNIHIYTVIFSDAFWKTFESKLKKIENKHNMIRTGVKTSNYKGKKNVYKKKLYYREPDNIKLLDKFKDDVNSLLKEFPYNINKE